MPAGRLAHPAAPVVHDGAGPSSGGPLGGPHKTATWLRSDAPNWGCSPVFLNRGCWEHEGSFICHSVRLARNMQRAGVRNAECSGRCGIRVILRPVTLSKVLQHPQSTTTFILCACRPAARFPHTQGFCRIASSLQLSGKTGSIFFGTLQKVVHRFGKAVGLMSMPQSKPAWALS